MPEPSEWDIQRAFTIFYKGECWSKGPLKGQWKSLPNALPGVVSWHTANSGEGRNAFQGMRLQQVGVEAGIPDYFFLWGGLYALEFKDLDGVLSKAQIALHPRLIAAGLVALETVDNLAAAKDFVRRHGLLIAGR